MARKNSRGSDGQLSLFDLDFLTAPSQEQESAQEEEQRKGEERESGRLLPEREVEVARGLHRRGQRDAEADVSSRVESVEVDERLVRAGVEGVYQDTGVRGVDEFSGRVSVDDGTSGEVRGDVQEDPVLPGSRTPVERPGVLPTHGDDFSVDRLAEAVGDSRGEEGESSDVHGDVSADGRTARPVDYRGTTSPAVSDRVQANVEAIELARQIVSENRYATGAEQEVLARFSGWGGLQEFFAAARDNSDDERVHRVQDLLGDEGFAEARRGLLTQHFTPTPVTETIWEALENLGFEDGRVLEPGSGLGSFIATAPDGAHMTGVELDSTTATISSLLYPSHEIRNEGYQDHQIEGTELYDAVVGNVPFGQIKLTGDKDPFPYEGSIHNYFLQKALWQTRPGGIVAVLSSTYTMDAKNPALRRLIYSLTSEGGLDADLLGAVRLPNGVFSRTANTEVASDILLFRRRLSGEDALPFDWEYSSTLSLEGNDFTVNSYWETHPDNVLGDFVLGSNQYGPALNVRGETDAQVLASGELRERLTQIVDEARSRGRAMSERHEETIQALPRVEIDKNRVGRLRINEENSKVEALNQYGDWVEKNKINADGTESKKPLAEKDIPQLRALLELRDKASELIATEAATTGYVPELENMRNDVREAYRSYVQAYECIGSREVQETYKKEKTGEFALDDEGNPIVTGIRVKSSEAIKIFRTDPDFATVFALEKYNSETNTAVEADILSRRTIRVEPKPLGVDNAQDAMRVSIAEHGRIDIDYMRFLLGEQDKATVEKELEGLAFRDPEKDGQWVSRAEYLSGNVRKKLARAEEAARIDDMYSANAEALRDVQPKDVPLTDVTIAPGAVWIPVSDHLDFFREVMLGRPSDDRAKLSFNPVSNTWNCSGGSAANAVWSPANPEHAWKFAADKTPSEVFKRTLNNSFEIVVERDGQKVVDRDASQQMRDAAERCKVEFNNWLWRDPNRIERLTRSYNDMFNSLVPRNYEAEGQALRLPGLSEAYKPHPWQKTAVARILAEPSTGLFHEVGAGKTLTMVMAAMEMKRLGMVSKPMFVVPNHMVEQFRNEWLQAYPAAKILTGEEVTSEKTRPLFVARVATEDWDGIVIPKSGFSRLPVSAQTEKEYLQDSIRLLEHAHAHANEVGDGESVAQLEKAIANEEKKLAKVGEKDKGVTFEETGVDFLFVDEAHAYKNLRRKTALAVDLDKKLLYLRNHSLSGKTTVLATATPIANTISEMHTMLHYLRPELLDETNVSSFDAWVTTFVERAWAPEISPEGKWRMVERYAYFHNLPELMQTWFQSADVKLAADIDLDTPEIKSNSDGKNLAEVITIDAGQPLREFMRDVSKRADKIRNFEVHPSQDNMLKLSSDARHASLDLRAYSAMDGRPDMGVGEETKIHAAALRIHEIYEATQHNEYSDGTGGVSETKGALQTVFLDLSTPKDDRWNAYDALKEELVSLGMTEESIRFIHEAASTQSKEELFRQARNGGISVLIGSTEKMGTGTNIQRRLIAQHHLDVPWRPCDVTQRDGRIVRQGNENSEVQIYRYVTLESYDTYMWQTVERKAKIINQIMGYKGEVRSIEDVDDVTEDYARTKALATGDDRYIVVTKLQADIATLSSQKRTFDNLHVTMAEKIRMLTHEEQENPRWRDLLARHEQNRVDTHGEAFSAVIDGTRFFDRNAAASVFLRNLYDIGAHGRRELVTEAARTQRIYAQDKDTIYIGGVPVIPLAVRRVGLNDAEVVVYIGEDYPQGDLYYSVNATDADSPNILTRTISWDIVTEAARAYDQGREVNNASVITSLENLVRAIPKKQEELTARYETVIKEKAELEVAQHEPFAQLALLEKLQNDFRAINRSMEMEKLEQELQSSLAFPQEHQDYYLGISTWADVRDLGFNENTYSNSAVGTIRYLYQHTMIYASYQKEQTQWHIAGFDQTTKQALAFQENSRGEVSIVSFDVIKREEETGINSEPAYQRIPSPTRPIGAEREISSLGLRLWAVVDQAMRRENIEYDTSVFEEPIQAIDERLHGIVTEAVREYQTTCDLNKEDIFDPIYDLMPSVKGALWRAIDSNFAGYTWQQDIAPDAIRTARHLFDLEATADSLKQVEETLPVVIEGETVETNEEVKTMNEENMSVEETIESFSERLEREKDTVRVCSTSGCMQCKATMRALDKAGIEYTEIKLDEDLEMMEYVKSLGYSAAPVVLAPNGEHWSGFRPDKIKELTQLSVSDQVESPTVVEVAVEEEEVIAKVAVTRDFNAELQAAEEEKKSLEAQREQLQAMPDAPWKEAGMRDLDTQIINLERRIDEIEQAQQAVLEAENALPMKDTPFGQIAAPDLYATDHLGSKATVVAHIFGPSQDWYISEYDEKTGEAFGWAEVIPGMGEYGYTNLYELSAAQDEIATQGMPISIELDQYWTPVTFDEAIAQHNRNSSPEPAHAIVGEIVEPIQGFGATEEENAQIDASFVETTYDLPSWYTLGDTYDTPDFSIANHVNKKGIVDNDFWSGIETWRATPIGVGNSNEDLPQLDEEIAFSARFESFHASYDIYDAAVAGTEVYVRAVYTDPNGHKSWVRENLSAIHESNPALTRVDIPVHPDRTLQAKQIENAISIEQSRKDKNIPYAPLMFMGEERRACTRIADGIDVAQYGEETYTIVNFNTYRHLPNAVRENAQIVDGVHMWRDMTGTEIEQLHTNNELSNSAKTVQLCESGQMVRALLVANDRDVNICANINPSWKDGLNSPGYGMKRGAFIPGVGMSDEEAYVSENFSRSEQAIKGEEERRQADERLHTFYQSVPTMGSSPNKGFSR